jgi:glycine dehydrogenase subunit 1
MPYIPNTDIEQDEMLEKIGVKKFEELLNCIPKEVRVKEKLDLPNGLSEVEVVKELNKIAAENISQNDAISFLGGGSYDHFVPSVISSIISRSEFITAYTPYQAEVSQGTLQAIYEYQTMICRLTGMDVSNASMYDGGSALAEACLLAYHHKNKKEVILCGAINPNYIEVIKTICAHGSEMQITIIPHKNGIADLDEIKKAVSDKTAAIAVQHPNFFGNLEDVYALKEIAKANNSLFIVSIDPLSLGILNPPGEYGADIVTGEGQPLGIPSSSGGPYLGIFAVKQELLRKIPGRLSGMTLDKEGKRGFVLTLQTREQQIRREKATSNICSNQGLMMLASTVYMSLMGKQGISDAANLCLQNSHYLADNIAKIKGFSLKYNQPFFKEFVIKTPVPPKDIIEKLLQEKIFAGIDLSQFGEDGLLIAVTEKRNKAEMDKFIEKIKIFEK